MSHMADPMADTDVAIDGAGAAGKAVGGPSPRRILAFGKRPRTLRTAGCMGLFRRHGKMQCHYRGTEAQRTNDT